MYVTECAPNPSSLGAVNGLSQTIVSVARAIGPTLSTSLFCFSIQCDFVGGYGVYAILASFATLALYLAIHLPRQPRTPAETDDKFVVRGCPAN